MEAKLFQRAQEELEAVDRSLQEMRAASDVHQLAAAWSDYLVHTQRAFTRLRMACKAGPSKGWCDQVVHTRSNDDLLRYIHHARNADEHGIEPIAIKQLGAVKLNPKPDANGAINIDHMVVGNGQIEMGPQAAAHFDIILEPAQVKPVSVRDRGIEYGVPKAFLGETFSNPTVIRIAEAGATFLRTKLEDAKAFG